MLQPSKPYLTIILSSVLGVLLLSLTGALMVLSPQHAQIENSKLPIPVTVEPVAEGTLRRWLHLEAEVKAGETRALMPAVSGTITHLQHPNGGQLSPGDRVSGPVASSSQGDLILSIDPQPMINNLLQTRLERSAVEEKINSLTEELELKKGQQVRLARDAVEAREKRERREIAAQDYESAIEAVEEIDKEIRVVQSGLFAEEDKLVFLDKKIELLKEKLTKTDLYAPFDGHVLEVNVQPGQVYNADEAPMVPVLLGKQESFFLQATVQAAEDTAIKVGTTAYLVDNEVAEKAEADQLSVDRIDDDLFYTVRVTDVQQRVIGHSIEYAIKCEPLFNPSILSYGERIQLIFPVEVKQNVLFVNQDSLVDSDGENLVYIQDGRRAVSKVVETGLRDFDRVEITDGLKQGDPVIRAGADFLTQGSSIEIVDAGEFNQE